MVLDFSWAVKTQSVCWLPLKKFVHEISSLHRPIGWQILFFYRSLLLENLISDVLASFAHIGSAAHHKLVGYHTESKVVNSNIVVLATHNFRGHVSGSA